jgi:dienelactone hydrolase
VRHRSGVTLALLILGNCSLPLLARAAGPRITPIFPRIASSEDFHWSVPLFIVNPLDHGLYVDSMSVDVEDRDPGETGGSRLTHIDMPYIARTIHSVSAGDSNRIQYEGEALAERATLTFHLRLHGSAGDVYSASTTVEADPGPLSTLYPSAFLTVGGHKVETVLVAAPAESLPASGVLLVHERGSDARKMLKIATRVARRGSSVMVVSLPGYGQSQGPADLAGPASLEAAAAALALLEKSPGVDPKRIGAWGVGEGASVVMQLARQKPELRAVVAESGTYDLWSAYRGADAPGRAAIVAAAGSDSTGWRHRSPALGEGKVTAAVMVLHGERDTVANADQARDFVARLEQQGTRVEAKMVPMGDHRIRTNDAQRQAIPFLVRELHR